MLHDAASPFIMAGRRSGLLDLFSMLPDFRKGSIAKPCTGDREHLNCGAAGPGEYVPKSLDEKVVHSIDVVEMRSRNDISGPTESCLKCTICQSCQWKQWGLGFVISLVG